MLSTAILDKSDKIFDLLTIFVTNHKYILYLNIMLLIHPSIDPVIVSFGAIQIRWYGIAYVLGFIIRNLYH